MVSAEPTKPAVDDEEIIEQWTKVRTGLTNVFTQKMFAMKAGTYMQYYSNVYSLIMKLKDPNLGMNKMGKDLYPYVLEFLTENARSLRAKLEGLTGLELLEKYTNIWKHYNFASNVADGIVGYLNRHFIRFCMECDVDWSNEYCEVTTVYNLCLLSWQKEVFEYIEDQLIRAAYQLIQMERQGGSIKMSLIKDVVESCVHMGINDVKLLKTDKKKSLVVYETCFEERFLRWTIEHYISEAQDFLQQNNIVDYMKLVEQRIIQEEERVERYLNKSTYPKLMNAVDKAMIIEYIDRFRAEFDNMLEHNQIANLTTMYKLCRRVEGALDALKDKLKVHITQKGHQAVEHMASEQVDPKAYVTAILNVHTHYQQVVHDAFDNDNGFVQSLDTAMTTIINQNALTDKARSSAKTSELLARYCDFLLRKSTKALPESEIEDAMDKRVMIFFRYIEDKDVFHGFYTQMLAKRMINDVSLSEDLECQMIAKFKQMCGFEYVSKLQRMYQDNAVSRELTSEFKGTGKSGKDTLDLSVLVVAQGVWPLKHTDMPVPRVLETPLTAFQVFYNNKFNGRKLHYINNMGRGEVTCNAFSRKYGFTVNTSQLSVMMLYNDAESYTVQQLVDNLSLSLDALPAVFTSMIKLELFKVEGGQLTPDTPLDTEVKLNKAFTSRKLKIDISKSVARTETRKEEADVAADVQEGRKLVIQAAIVRVMKMRKTFGHSQLITEVIKQLSVRFKPNIKMIKKCIDILIEKQYLERLKGDRESYEYIS